MKKLISAIMALAVVSYVFMLPINLVGDHHTNCKKFLEDKKCNACHPVESLGIEAKQKNPKTLGPDFGKVPLAGDFEFLKKYLLKEEKLHDKLHPVKFSGSDAEMEEMLNCLAELAPKAESEENTETQE